MSFRILTVTSLILCPLFMHRVQPVTDNTPLLLLDYKKNYTAPFQEGEKLRYEVNWKPLFVLPPFKAGELVFTVRKHLHEKKAAWAITMDAISTGKLSEVTNISVQNHFESIIDALHFHSYKILQKRLVGKRKRESLAVFNYRKGITFYRELDVSLDPPKELRKEITHAIPGPLIDLLSSIYVARLHQLKVEQEYSANLGNNGKVRAVKVYVEKQEKVLIRIGSFNTVRLRATGGIISHGRTLRVWYSQNGIRVPVKFEAEVKFGRIYGELIQMESGSTARKMIRVR